MHLKYDISLKDAFYIINLAAEIFFGKFWIISKEADFVPSLFLLINLTFPSHQPQITISSGRRKTEADEKEKWGGWEGKVRGQNVPLCLWFKIFKKKISVAKSMIKNASFESTSYLLCIFPLSTIYLKAIKEDNYLIPNALVLQI